jgi:hypothetical protein
MLRKFLERYLSVIQPANALGFSGMNSQVYYSIAGKYSCVGKRVPAFFLPDLSKFRMIYFYNTTNYWALVNWHLVKCRTEHSEWYNARLFTREIPMLICPDGPNLPDGRQIVQSN